MVDVPLFDKLMDACPHKPQLIFLGDIQQLPPVFGSSILGFKMLELPIIELTEVYRQARNSPIIDLAWKLLEGNASYSIARLKQYK
jgi:exodeoxyribonuclease V alpha subunit